MGRRIISTTLQARGGPEQIDTFAARIVKYIPADIVAAWVALVALLPQDVPHRVPLLWGCFVVVLVVTPFWILRVTRAPGQPPARTQVLISTAAFAVWVFATGLPFSHYSFYHPAQGGIALILFTLISGVVDPARHDPRPAVDPASPPRPRTELPADERAGDTP